METITVHEALACANTSISEETCATFPNVECISTKCERIGVEGAKDLASALERGVFPRLK